MQQPLNFNSAVLGIPTGEDFERLEADEQRACIRLLIERIIRQLDDQAREPDTYEREQLGKAIFCVRDGFLPRAVQHAMIACTPADDRKPIFGAGIYDVPEGVSLRQLLSEVPL